MNATWSVRIERLLTQLRVGIYDHELLPQPVAVTLRLRGVSPACPKDLSECIDYEPILRWLAEEWPRTPHIPLLETRVNELLAFSFGFDDRVQEVHVELAKRRICDQAVSVGIARSVSRAEFEAQRLHQEAGAASPTRTERTCDERLPA